MYDIRCLEGGRGLWRSQDWGGGVQKGLLSAPAPWALEKYIFLGPFGENSGKIRLYIYFSEGGGLMGPWG